MVVFLAKKRKKNAIKNNGFYQDAKGISTGFINSMC